MRCTRKVSTTSCCYVQIDGEKFLLTVNHFIEDSRSKNDNGMEDKLSLTSPALLEMDELLKYYNQFLRSVDIEIEEAIRTQYGEIWPSELEYSDKLQALEEEKNYAQSLLEETSARLKDENYLILASFVHQSKSGSRIPVGATTALWSERGYIDTEIRHLMDWALYSVSNRAGVNRIRHEIDPDERMVDYYAGDTENLGAGEPCQRTCNVEPNAEVYYVGQTSGRQTAEINAAPMLVSRGGTKTLEWTLTVPEKEQKEDSNYAGDSGVGIMRISDNSFVGLLWGC